jgi:MSHA biogenesis protein MshL
MKTVTFAFGAFAAVLALGGCGTTPPRNGTTYDKIAAELKDATENRTAREQNQGVLQSLLPPLVIELPKAEALEAGQRFDLIVNNAPAPQVLGAIVSGTRYSMVVHPDIKAPMSLSLKDVTIAEVLSSVREIYGYEYKIDGTRIFVMPATLQTRMFKIDYLTSLRRGSTDLRVSSNAVTTTGSTSTAQPGAQPLGGVGAVGAMGALGGATLEPGTLPGGAQSGLAPGQSTQVGTTDASDFWRELRKTLAALIGCGIGERIGKDGQSTRTLNSDDIACEGGRRLVVSPQSGMVLARVMPDEMKSIAEYLRASQTSLDKQVLIEAKILEVALKDGYETGINWSKFFALRSGTFGLGQLTPGTQLGTNTTGVALQGGTPPTGQMTTPLTAGIAATTSAAGAAIAGLALDSAGRAGQVLTAGLGATGSLFGVAFQGANFALLMSFLESQGVVHTLSSPRISTMNNQKAVLKVGSDALFVTKIESGNSTTTAVAGTAAAPSIPTFNVQSFFSGIALDVTPHIGDDDNIVLHVRPSVSTVTQNLSTFNLGILGTFIIPLVSNQISETDSVIRAKDSQIVAIGGLMRQVQSETRDQIPGLGGIPFVGAAFRNTQQASEKRELVILLKPTVVQSDQSWAQNIDDARNRVQTLDRGFSWGGRSEVFGTRAEERKP